MCCKSPDWVRTFPELETRPLLVAAMEGNHKLRRKVFHIVNVYGVLADIADINVAMELISLYEIRVKEVISSIKEEIETQDYRLFGELSGFLRNTLINIKQKVNPSNKHRYGKHGHDIVRHME